MGDTTMSKTKTRQGVGPFDTGLISNEALRVGGHAERRHHLPSSRIRLDWFALRWWASKDDSW